MNKDNKDLIKLKKALYLKKYSKKKEGNKLLEEIISENSTWKDTALELLKQDKKFQNLENEKNNCTFLYFINKLLF